VQIEVLGNGTVTLPEGVSFPGAYSYEDPGVVHNVCSLFHPSLTPLHFTHLTPPSTRYPARAPKFLLTLAGVLLHQNQNLHHPHTFLHNFLHHPRPNSMVWRVGRHDESKCAACCGADDACTMEHVDCQQCGDERDVCG
jgi:hypothetical protein